ncbi:hypothetical protein STIUS_v1c03000 [Spiroplasma sp. TIUS-1]|uniref:hypothetical protein n=1 Tax=Spiroplasma sp. TIUS-1 TaxID=216963 RepID=UPI001396F319|nr:hypothetical protein [Spiroplasma sp. TIUS-1]QHX35854.1 hypothetical protein STIUS_v1c03000 [Spiroplasma sp. TIUS-1]
MLNLFSFLKNSEETSGKELTHSAALTVLIIGIICIVAAAVLFYFFILHIKRSSFKEKQHAEQFRRAFWWDEPMKFWSFYVYAFMCISLILGFIVCLIISIPVLV